MDRSTDIPTLLVFTLGPECEHSRRRLLPGSLRQAEASLHRQGLAGALSAGRRAGYRLVVSSPEPLDLAPGVEQLIQRGCTFAERLRDAIRSLQSNLASSPLLVVGTDTPDLDVHHLRSAVSLLADSPRGVVIGPSLDGGFYLLATRTPLDKELSRARWCRSDTRRTLEAALRRSGRLVRHLELLQDLDRPADVELWLSNRPLLSTVGWLRRLLISLLAAWRRPVIPLTFDCPGVALATIVLGRGPPF